MTASEAPLDDWRMLHPASVLVNLVPRTLNVLRNAWWLILALLYGRTSSSADAMANTIDLSLLLVFFMMTVGGTVLHFLTLRYRVVDGRLEIRTGLLNRQTRVISADRIQNTETVRNVFHRLSGLVEVRVETASGTEVEGLLSALSADDARRLTEALDTARSEVQPDDATDESEWPVVVQNGLLDLIWFGGTGTRVGAIAVLLGIAVEGLTVRTSTMNPEDLDQVGGIFGGLGGLALLVAAISGAWLLGVGTAVLRHYGFTLRQRGPVLIAEEGLFTRRRVELRMSKVQLVTVVEPFLRRLAGFGSVHLETAAAREGGDGTQRAEAIVPVVQPDELDGVVDKAVPTGTLQLTRPELLPPHPRALWRASAAGAGRAAILAAVISWWLWPTGLAAWLLVPLALLLARLDHRFQGWRVTDDVIVSRKGYLTRRTWIVARRKLQSTQLSQGPILRRYGLGQLRVRVAGSSVALPILAWEDALALQRELLVDAMPEEDDLPRLSTDAIEPLEPAG